MRTRIDASIIPSLKQQIGHYQNKGEFCISPEGEQELYRDIEEYEQTRFDLAKTYIDKFHLHIDPQDSSDPQFFRKQFLEYIQNHSFPVYAGDPEKRKTNPEQATINMEDLLDEQGAYLYKRALAEEMNSREFRDAVVIKSTTHFDGARWLERPVVIVGGPSASGKSYAAQAAVEKAKEFLAADYSDMSGNNVVAADGGIVREVSQMRKLVIQLANNQGYTGIKNLHGESNKIMDVIKDHVREAAFLTPGIGVVIPETFTKGKSLLKRIGELPDTKNIFTRVVGQNDTIFQKVVAFMGSRRAWKTKDFNPEPLDLNKTGLCESKAYGKNGFFWGKLFSERAEKEFREKDKNKLYMRITNDLIIVKPDPAQPGNWIPGKRNDEGARLISAGPYKQWKALPDNDRPELIAYCNANSKTLITTSPQIDFLIAQKHVEHRVEACKEKITKLTAKNPANEEKVRCLKTRQAFLEGLASFSLHNLDNWHDIRNIKIQIEDQLLTLSRDHNAKKILSRKTMNAVNEFLETLDKANKELQNSPTFYDDREYTMFFKKKYNEALNKFENLDEHGEEQTSPFTPS
ncbi:hypothetical protein OQJ18_15295 [Fluoribacter dumoffii]|uniref:Zeta toxin n=1 Tax=Fluoribacter dumoffii TaxID=463 RepID=A0A377GCS3_9GAMM|nr:hypothetical protein [Fluoribacter dumoffii]KTC90779.1 hypothetical protein Ldum_1847 [Fluoribacter dumoffii NY 23]MCW8386622.1 hypothetical protein [Fluoribacter dumoffii]MCW8419676.1 hypothetical protein [Fluoribacter dumoffii]MCW8455621.1 hypothetical protein [Fluoribacter dumoffii]MCW8460300.1 hypothetical protein [Fluoribacter dumoffii]